MPILNDEQLEALREKLRAAPLPVIDQYLTDVTDQIHELERIAKIVRSVHEEKMQEVNPAPDN